MLLVKKNLFIKITNTQPTFTCWKATIETPEQGANHAQSQQQSQWRRSGVFIINPKHITHPAPVSPSPTSNMQLPAAYLQLKPNIVKLLKYSKQ